MNWAFRKRRLYWSFKAFWARLSHWTNRALFSVRYEAAEERHNYRALQGLFRLTGRATIFALLTAALVQLVDGLLSPYLQSKGLKLPQDSDYVAFLVGIATLGGLFIGLYYAGLSAIGSAMYARVPNNIRNLLAQERSGITYMRVLSYMTILSLAFLGLRFVGFDRVFLAVPLLTLNSVVGVAAFVRLGQRAFDLFDPTALSRSVFVRLMHWLRQVAAGGFRWNQAEFQQHAHRQAGGEIETLETLADLISKESHLSGGGSLELARGIVDFLIRYERSKRRIPPESKWFEQRFEHRDWYGTEASTVSIAHQTGTLLSPKVTVDSEWIEKRLLKILTDWTCRNATTGRHTEALLLLDYVDAYSTALADEGRLDAAIGVAASMMSELLKRLPALQSTDEVLEVVAVTDRIALIPVSAAIGHRRFLQSLDAQSVTQRIRTIRWDEEKDLYLHDFPAHCLSTLEWLGQRLRNEIEIHGWVITPGWYSAELISQVRATRFVDNSRAISEKSQTFYTESMEQALKMGRPWIAAAIASRQWEFLHKIQAAIEIESGWADLCKDLRIEGLLWPQFDASAFRSGLSQRRDALIEFMSKQSVLLAISSKPAGYPDYAGQFLHAVGEECFEAAIHNKPSLLKEIFKDYLVGCILRYSSLRPRDANTDWRAERQYKLAGASLMDLMEISGYAKLLADFHGNVELWDIVRGAWDGAIADEPNLGRLLPSLIAVTEAAFEIPHRGVLRTNWKLRLNNVLASLPKIERQIGNERRFREPKADHPSALVRIFASGPYGSLHDGIDIFIGFYLKQRPELKDAKYGRKRRDIQDQINREETPKGDTGAKG